MITGPLTGVGGVHPDHPAPARMNSAGSASTTWSNLSDLNEDQVTGAGNPGLFALLNAVSRMDEEDEDGYSTNSSEPLTPESASLVETEDEQKQKSEGLAQLVQHRDETQTRLAQIISSTNNDFFGSQNSDLDVPSPSSPPGTVPSSATITPSSARSDELHRPQMTPSASTDSATPKSEKILRVIQDEFGVLTRGDEVEEFLDERECALLTDVTILGVLILTNFRVTFRASLSSTRAASDEQSQVIKSGPFVIHRPGLHRKQRRFLELSHDMLSVYRDSTDEARSRPIRSVLLSDVKKVSAYSKHEPTSVYVTFNRNNSPITCEFEFDTEESTLDWQRDLYNAVVKYRQRRHASLYDAEGMSTQAGRDAVRDGSGVRISVPLHRIDSFSGQRYLDDYVFILLRINEGTWSSAAQPSSTWNQDAKLEEFLDSELRSKSAYSTANSTSGKREIKLMLFGRGDSGRDRFWKTIDDAKSRWASHEGEKTPESDVVTVNFGPLVFEDEAPTTTSSPKQAEAQRNRKIDDSMRKMFAIDSSVDIFVTRAWLHSRICSAGYFLVSSAFICFWSKSFTSKDVKFRFPTKDVNAAIPLPDTILGNHVVGLEVKGQPTFQFTFRGIDVRDMIVKRIEAAKAYASSMHSRQASSMSMSPSSSAMGRSPSESGRSPKRSGTLDSVTTGKGPSPLGSTTLLQTTSPEEEYPPSETLYDYDDDLEDATDPTSKILAFVQKNEVDTRLYANFPKPINLPNTIIRGMRSRHFFCLTIGSRGDVQPYIALCRGLIEHGHKATIVTHEEYKEWVEGFGVNHRTAGGDPGALMKLSVEHSMFSPQFFKESIGKFRGWLDDLLKDAWEQCQGADVLIESPSAMAGVHIAEALKIPYIRAFTMPWTRTSAYPHAFLSPPVELSGGFNYTTYVVFDNIFWKAMAGQVNRWRKNMLQIKRTDIDTLAQTKIPFIYNFSDSVVPKPLDWSDIITVSGYWFLDNPDLKWQPAPELLAWIAKAKEDNVPIVYIGFGSIVVPHPQAMTRSIIKGVQSAGVRAIISKGWSDRLAKKEDGEVTFPPECFSLDKVPHDWLFPQIDAAMHHGGAGTTGASLRAGIPTIIKPWFGDQYFWASRVHKLGAGLRVDNLASTELAHALKRATSDRVMKEKAAAVGERIRKENGVENAIRAIYLYLDRAGKDRKTL